MNMKSVSIKWKINYVNINEFSMIILKKFVVFVFLKSKFMMKKDLWN